MRLRLIIVILAVSLGAALLFWLVHRSRPPAVQSAVTAPPAGSGAPGAAPASGQRALQLDIQHLGLTPERATKYFSLTVGPLPGVSVDGVTRDPGDIDGSEAVLYLYKEWRALTPDQRTAAARLVHPPAPARGRSGPP